MTAHELARILLEGPDVPVILGNVDDLDEPSGVSVVEVWGPGPGTWDHWWSPEDHHRTDVAVMLS